MKKNSQLRRIACHEILLPNGQILPMSVVEIQSGKVLRYYPLVEEQAATEWWKGSIRLKVQGDGSLKAFYEGHEIV
jgi:hypothetical protein